MAHHRARFTARGRMLVVGRVVDDGETFAQAAAWANVSTSTVWEWVAGGSFVNLTASVRLKTDVMAHRTTIVTRRGEAGQPARSWRAATQGLPPGLVAGVAVIVVLVPVLVTIAQAFGGGLTAAFNAIKATSATSLLLHTGLVTAPAGANRQDLFRADRRFTTADVRV